jgi:predicted dehydrogenase
MKKVRVLVVGLGNMGLSHARAYQSIKGFQIAGLCSRGIETREDIRTEFPNIPTFSDYATALDTLRPDAVSINTWPDTHAAYAKMALQAGCHIFIEKPLADTVAEAEEIVALANAAGKKLVIGYILRVHPSWVKFVEVGKTLGKPLVMRMNLNQQSSGAQWDVPSARLWIAAFIMLM